MEEACSCDGWPTAEGVNRHKKGVSVAPVALLAPGVAVHVVAVALPEAGGVLVEEPEAPHPLHRLPEIEVRHHQSQRPPVVGFEWLASERVGEEVLGPDEICDRNVGREALLGQHQHMAGARRGG